MVIASSLRIFREDPFKSEARKAVNPVDISHVDDHRVAAALGLALQPTMTGVRQSTHSAARTSRSTPWARSCASYIFLQQAGARLDDNGSIVTIVTALLAAYT